MRNRRMSVTEAFERAAAVGIEYRVSADGHVLFFLEHGRIASQNGGRSCLVCPKLAVAIRRREAAAKQRHEWISVYRKCRDQTGWDSRWWRDAAEYADEQIRSV